jgi:hypothetical protein
MELEPLAQHRLNRHRLKGPFMTSTAENTRMPVSSWSQNSVSNSLLSGQGNWTQEPVLGRFGAMTVN